MRSARLPPRILRSHSSSTTSLCPNVLPLSKPARSRRNVVRDQVVEHLGHLNIPCIFNHFGFGWALRLLKREDFSSTESSAVPYTLGPSNQANPTFSVSFCLGHLQTSIWFCTRCSDFDACRKPNRFSDCSLRRPAAECVFGPGARRARNECSDRFSADAPAGRAE